MTKAVRPVLWYHGLLLQPQHFQQSDLYLQSLFSPLGAYQQPYYWGIRKLVLQESALKNGWLEVVEGEFLFPDGGWTVFPGNTLIQPRSLEKVKPPETGSLQVYLGLRKWDPAGRNVSLISPGAIVQDILTRYAAYVDPEDVKDVYQGGPDASVRYLNYVIRIFWQHELENLGNYWLMPIARLNYDGKVFSLVKEYVPPAIMISSSDLVVRHVRNIRDQMMARCRVLESYKIPRGSQSVELEPNYMIYMLALRSLNRYLPLLYHLTETPDIHPWQVYGLLRQIIGELSSFTDRFNALGKLAQGTELLPTYDHTELGRCFSEAETLISELLEAIIIGAENVVTLKKDGVLFRGELSEDLLNRRNIFYLMIETTAEAENVVNEIEHLAKVASSEQIQTLVSRALPGVPLQHSPVPPPGLPQRADAHYFRIDRDNRLWHDLRRSGDFSLYWDTALADARVKLIILRS